MSEVLFSAESVIIDVNVVSQKQLFQEMAARLIEARQLDVSARDVVAAAMAVSYTHLTLPTKA